MHIQNESWQTHEGHDKHMRVRTIERQAPRRCMTHQQQPHHANPWAQCAFVSSKVNASGPVHTWSYIIGVISIRVTYTSSLNATCMYPCTHMCLCKYTCMNTCAYICASWANMSKPAKIYITCLSYTHLHYTFTRVDPTLALALVFCPFLLIVQALVRSQSFLPCCSLSISLSITLGKMQWSDTRPFSADIVNG